MPWWNQWTFDAGWDITTHSSWALNDNLLWTIFFTDCTSGGTIRKKLNWGFIKLFKYKKSETHTKRPYRCRLQLADQHHLLRYTQFSLPYFDSALPPNADDYSLNNLNSTDYYAASRLSDEECHVPRTQFQTQSPVSLLAFHLVSIWHLADLYENLQSGLKCTKKWNDSLISCIST